MDILSLFKSVKIYIALGALIAILGGGWYIDHTINSLKSEIANKDLIIDQKTNELEKCNKAVIDQNAQIEKFKQDTKNNQDTLDSLNKDLKTLEDTHKSKIEELKKLVAPTTCQETDEFLLNNIKSRKHE